MKQLLGDWPGRLLVIGLLLGLIVLAFLTIQILLVPIVAASFVAYLFDPVIVAMQRRGMERGKAFLILLGVSSLVILALLRFAPQWLRVETTTRPSEESFTERVDIQVRELEGWMNKRFPTFQSIDISSRVASRAGQFAEAFVEGLPALVSAFLLNLLLVPFIAYFMVRDGRTLRRHLVSMVPNRYFEMALMMLHRIDRQIGGYLRGRLIECMLVALTQMLAMGVAGLFVDQPQILLISIVGGITNLIPYVGPLMGAGFGAMLYLAAYDLPMSAVYGLLIAIFVAHIVDNVAIAPLVLSHNVDLHPLTVALVLVIGGELLGVLGLLIAIPVAASLKVVVQECYANYQLQSRLSD